MDCKQLPMAYPHHLAPRIDALPVEILSCIFKLLPRHPRAFARLCRVCKFFRFVAIELLYSNITIRAVDESTLDPLIMECLLYVNNPGVKYIRNIAVRGNIRSNLKIYDYQSVRKISKMGNRTSGTDGCSPTMLNITLMLCMLLDKVPEGRLESFVWDVDTYFSWTLTDKLQERHPNLKILQLRDGDEDPFDRSWLEELKFSNLHSLEWGNITSHEVLTCLGTWISSNARTLRSLACSLRAFEDIKADYWGHLEGQDEGGLLDEEAEMLNFLPRLLFQGLHKPHSRTCNLLAGNSTLEGDDEKSRLGLDRLSLDQYPMGDSAHGLLRGYIDISNLRNLSLRRCAQTQQFLESWVTSTDTIRLKSLELLLETGSEGIVPFIDAFTGLENLYLLFENLESMSRTDAIFESIYKHKATLCRLVIDIKRHGKTMGISTSNIAGIKKHLKITEIGIAFKPEDGVRSEFHRRRMSILADDGVGDHQMRDSGLEFLCTTRNNQINAAGTIRTIHIRNLRRPVYKPYEDPFVGTRNFLMSKTFRHRKVDAETMIEPLKFGHEVVKPGSLEAILIGPVDEKKPYESLGAATEFSCFLMDYVKTRVGTGLPVLNSVSMDDLRYFGVPCQVANVRW